MVLVVFLSYVWLVWPWPLLNLCLEILDFKMKQYISPELFLKLACYQFLNKIP